MKKNLILIFMIGILISLLNITYADSGFEVGDYVKFGSYYNEPIIWRVIHIDKERNPLLFSDKILCLKAFDSKGDYHSDVNRRKFGSNEWEFSNIRQWLNSSEEEIKWIQNSPTTSNLSEGYNSYYREIGFLHDKNFSKQEKDLIKSVNQKVLLAEIDKNRRDGGSEPYINNYYAYEVFKNYDEAYYKNIKDKVFFLSVKELKEYVYDREWEIRAKPTSEAVRKSTHNKVYFSHINPMNYWSYYLRSPASDTYYVRSVNSLGDLGGNDYYAYSGTGGIRPALFLNMENAELKDGLGTLSSPYIVGTKTIQIILKGNSLNLEHEPVVLNGRMLVPIRAIFEAIEMEIHWDHNTKTIKGKKDGLEVLLTIDKKKAFLNNKELDLEVPPTIINGRTLVPLRFIAESTGLKVNWDSKNKLINIY